MYLSKLQKFILKRSFKNLSKENLDLESDAIHKFLTPKEEKEKKIDIINTSIDQLLELKEKSKSKNTAIEDRKLQGQVLKTYIKGELDYQSI